MVVYLDLAFLMNSIADGLALYITARAAGLTLRWRRILAAAMLGGVYGLVCLLPGMTAAADFFPQMAVAAGLVWFSFGGGQDFLRRFLLFFIISCTMSGVMVALLRLLQNGGGMKALEELNWKVFFLVTVCCYFFLSVVFRGGAKHAVAGELRRGFIARNGCWMEFTALLDTGHTLTDGIAGRAVLIMELTALKELWSAQEWEILKDLPLYGPTQCMERLTAISPEKFRLLPYQAVGVSTGMLLCFRADHLVLDGCEYGTVTVAISPTPVSDGGGYTALWGGERRKREEHHAA